MILITVCHMNVYDLYLLDANGAAVEVRRNVGSSEAYAMIEGAKQNGIAIVTVD